ncbi:MAG TPA: DUF5683 domain-containing protein, partial [Longimicrobium sp.]|nr:DUF5683 domain-containing protein [Longimicrobium sp.]
EPGSTSMTMTHPLPRRLAILLPLAVLALAAPARAQVPGDTARAVPADTARPLEVRGAPARPDTVPRRHRISPGGAFIRSLVLPGWGQSSIGAPGRGAVYFALEAGSLWMVYKSDRKLQEANERDRILREQGQLQEGQASGLTRDRRAQREDWITLSIFWLFFSGADAFVAAHLRDFDEHVGVEPSPSGGMRLQASVPIGNE